MLTIDYYSDILCVWAWIAQRRIDELQKAFDGRIELRHHYMDVFGDVQGKMARQWQERGGIAAFAEHVHASAAEYEDAPVHADLWYRVQPTTSANAHAYIKALGLAMGETSANRFARRLREAFFIEAVDISDMKELHRLAVAADLDPEPVHALLSSGRALAALLSDYRNAGERNLRGSPSYIMNDERQTLYGNVGYRVLSANVEELLKNVQHEASWC